MSAHSFETGRRDLCSETSLGGLEPKLNPSRLLCFITTKSRQHATVSHAHLHLYTGLTGRRVEEPIHPPVGRLPKMPPIQTHTHAHTYTHAQIPGLASAQCWITGLELYSIISPHYTGHTHTHTMTHCFGQRRQAEDRRKSQSKQTTFTRKTIQ